MENKPLPEEAATSNDQVQNTKDAYFTIFLVDDISGPSFSPITTTVVGGRPSVSLLCLTDRQFPEHFLPTGKNLLQPDSVLYAVIKPMKVEEDKTSSGSLMVMVTNLWPQCAMCSSPVLLKISRVKRLTHVKSVVAYASSHSWGVVVWRVSSSSGVVLVA
ncbi:hypothetical protein TNCV_1704461 [Trichonephila clavipes]|nr:hypothetical protein TNCV_1704461 [Trichonephila clavipes]